MRLGLVMLDQGSTLNNLKYLNQVYINPGDSASVFFQVIDLDTVSQNNLIGNRYIPVDGATMVVVIQSVNDANTLTLAASQPFPLDNSIWMFSMSSAQTKVCAGVNIMATLTQGAQINNLLGQNVLFMNPASPYCC